MKFLWTTIEVVNVDESVRFYQEIVGLSVDHRIAGEATDIAFMGDGETKIELIAHEGAKPQTGGALISLGFAVDDLDAKIAFLCRSGESTSPRGRSLRTPESASATWKTPTGCESNSSNSAEMSRGRDLQSQPRCGFIR